MSQGRRIIGYLENHPEGITPMEAFNNLRITKLATRVSELISEGYRINKEFESHKNSDGEIVRYMRYKLEV